ncbi:MAG: GNAT family N-acetyltransferase [Phycicoccus sp.]|nr:GNAT family N-acetyltransferase [Phycicoccus sp.]
MSDHDHHQDRHDALSGDKAAARVTVERATESAKPLVRRLLELNAHDFSEFDGRDVSEHGEFGYRYLDHYWTEPEDRQALLIRCNNAIAGVALVRRGAPHQVAEFFILRKFRRRGVGLQAAREALRTWPGQWETHEVPNNDGAVSFWRTAIPVAYTEDADDHGTTQRFVITDAMQGPQR